MGDRRLKATAIVCENDKQLAKITAVRDQLTNIHTIIMIDPVKAEPTTNGASAGAPAFETVQLEEVRARGQTAPRRSSKRVAPR